MLKNDSNPLAKPSSSPESCDHKATSQGKSSSSDVSNLIEEPSTRTSPRYSRTVAMVEESKDADHTMLGTIKARRAINGRNVSQENYFTFPNTRRVRNEKQENNSSSSSISLSNIRSKSNGSSISPLCKKRRIT